VIVPFGIAFYWFSLATLLPKAYRKRKPLRYYIWKSFLFLAVSLIPVGLLVMPFVRNSDFAVPFTFINAAFQLLITSAISWFVYKHQVWGNEEIIHLKQELGQSTASFDFLRSQINPHFLFNALNTIYGTAIEEGAERTSEGVQKLGDMMRFMLQENMQDKIALSREIDYLNNYIGLQRLRTDANPVVKIHATIEQPVAPVQVAPMLLIPFVENAFKHGISLREPSHISITLELKNKTLLFDVYNSKHVRNENDPERDKSGIGLNNVRQRLQLLYPSRHELVVRETAKDFFVHLTIQLS
jgi:LytS/YehU family sensor histidine kinase